ncbi:CDC50/LEM3 family like protein [Aduncisulcus paluster]|nr:CDC50/LEM3 family like protein [Aduncisulcus paluster]
MGSNFEDAQVWARPAALPKFRKLYRRIDDGLVAGTYSVSVSNNFPMEYQGASKEFVVATVNSWGVKNSFLPLTSIVAGGISVLLAALGLVVEYCIPRSKRYDDL